MNKHILMNLTHKKAIIAEMNAKHETNSMDSLSPRLI